MSGYIVVAFLIATSCLFLAYGFISEWRKQQVCLPIICVCEVNGRIGIVLRRDYDQASREHWKPYCKGEVACDTEKMRVRGHLLRPSPVFVFATGSCAYNTVVNGCYIERATFEVPATKSFSEPLAEAHLYLYGKPWDRQLITW